MQWKEIELTDREIMQQAFDNFQSQASEMSFANMFMWRKNYNTRYAILNNMLCMVSKPRLYKPFAFCPVPCGEYHAEEFKETLSQLNQYFISQGWKFKFGRVEERMLERFQNDSGGKIAAKEIEATEDYLYHTESLIALGGKKLSAKRNHINKFFRTYGDFEYIQISSETVEDCKRIFVEWCEKNEACDCEIPEECERWACSQLLENWDRIPGLRGALIKVNGRSEAFTIGERLNQDTAVIHIEKGNTDIEGIYPLINREFLTREFSETRFVNREEDMGKEGLRKAKLSYQPLEMVRKFDIYPEMT